MQSPRRRYEHEDTDEDDAPTAPNQSTRLRVKTPNAPGLRRRYRGIGTPVAVGRFDETETPIRKLVVATPVPTSETRRRMPELPNLACEEGWPSEALTLPEIVNVADMAHPIDETVTVPMGRARGHDVRASRSVWRCWMPRIAVAFVVLVAELAYAARSDASLLASVTRLVKNPSRAATSER